MRLAPTKALDSSRSNARDRSNLQSLNDASIHDHGPGPGPRCDRDTGARPELIIIIIMYYTADFKSARDELSFVAFPDVRAAPLGSQRPVARGFTSRSTGSLATVTLEIP